MISKKLKFVLIACISAVLAAAAILSVFIVLNNSSDFSAEINEADLNLNSGFLREAEKNLQNAYRLIGNSKEALSFLKRYDRLSSASGDYSNYADYADRILSEYRRNIEIAAVAAYAQQKNKNYRKSLMISEQKLDNSDYNSIHLLNILKNDLFPADLRKRERFDSRYGYLFGKKPYSADQILNAADALSDQRLVADAALLLMEEGRKEEAYSTISLTDESRFREIKAFIAYDNEDYAAAGGFWPYEDLFNIDILLRTGKTDPAKDACIDFIRINPDKSPVPYRNLYALNSTDNAGIDWLSRGLEYFPDDENLLVSAAWEYYLNNDSIMLREVLNNISTETESAVAGLFRVNMMIKGRSPEHVAGNFWTVYNLDPASEITAISFANYLLENKQFDQLDLLLARYTEDNGERKWVYEYTAVKDALNGNYEDAETGFQKAAELHADAMNLYNLGVILLLKKNYKNAAENFEKALMSAETDNTAVDYKSKIYLKLAETNYNIHEFEKALFFANRSIELNPDDTRSRLMLARIKEEYND